MISKYKDRTMEIIGTEVQNGKRKQAEWDLMIHKTF